MHIKLIAPRFSLRPMDSDFKRLMAPPLGLVTLASLTPVKHRVTIADANIRQVDYNDKPDLVGITATVDTAYRAYEIADCYREKGVPVIMGGIHVSANPDEALQHAEAVCIGEAESVWHQILLDAEGACLKGKYSGNPAGNLDRLPVVDYSGIDTACYLYSNITYTSRNCPFQCEFCYNSCSFTGHYRNRAIPRILEEIRARNTKHIMFIDDNFIGNISWTRDFLKVLKRLGLKWNAAVTANLVHYPHLLDLMKESGCMSLFIGFETINQSSLESVHKQQNNIALYNKLIREIHNREIMINASLVFGFDSDSPGVFRQTLAWLVENRIETMTAHILTPYPGTRLYERFREQNRITDYDWSHYNTSHVVFQPANMSRGELYEGYLWIYREFYSLKNILKRMPHNRQHLPYLIFNFVYRKFGKLVADIGKKRWMQTIGRLAARLAYGFF